MYVIRLLETLGVLTQLLCVQVPATSGEAHPHKHGIEGLFDKVVHHDKR